MLYLDFFCLNNIPAIASKTGGDLFCIRIFPLRKPTILHIIEAWNKMQNNHRMMVDKIYGRSIDKWKKIKRI